MSAYYKRKLSNKSRVQIMLGKLLSESAYAPIVMGNYNFKLKKTDTVYSVKPRWVFVNY